MKKKRADELLYEHGHCESRQDAALLIMAGKVRSGKDALVTKPSQEFPADTVLTVDSGNEFVSRGDFLAHYWYSLTCLQNAAHIMRVLQDVYQETYERRLTLKRLGEVFTYPRIPDIDVGVKFDENMDPTRFIENDIERLLRMQWKEGSMEEDLMRSAAGREGR